MNRVLTNVIFMIYSAIVFLVLFFIAPLFNTTFWTVFSFIAFSLLTDILLWNLLLGKKLGYKSFYKYPAAVITDFNMFIQLLIAIIFALLVKQISLKICIFINAIIYLINMILVLSTFISANHVKSLDSRQKNHHTEIN